MELDLTAEGAAVTAERYAAARMGLLPSWEAVDFLDTLMDQCTEALCEVKSLRDQLSDASEYIRELEADVALARSERDTANAEASR